MNISPLGRGVAALAMTLIAAATVVSLTRTDAPARSAPGDTDLPGIAAAAPDVATQKLIDSGELDPGDLFTEDGVNFPTDFVDDSNTSNKPTTGSTSNPSTAPVPPPPPAGTPAPAPQPPPTSAPAPEPEPAPAPAPSKKPGLKEFVNGLFGK